MKDSKIEWTDHTFNPWWGCERVSPACKHCYAETFAKRVGQRVWGPGSPRRFFGDRHWDEPLRWDADAAAAGSRARVFCASMADVFEDRRDLDASRTRLWDLIARTPSLDWLLLTKRIEAVRRLSPWRSRWPANIWIGATVEDQRRVTERLPILAELRAAVRFISAEPLLGPLDLRPWISSLDWVIVGGESGHGARPSAPSRLAELRDQCLAADVAFLFKQWGNWSPCRPSTMKTVSTMSAHDGAVMFNVGKTAAGRLLAGRAWNELPIPRGAFRAERTI